MKTKILYTDGKRTVELLWLRHTGTDVYVGHPKTEWKRSYHATGKLHTREGRAERDANWVAPLSELKGAFHLLTIAFSSSQAFVRNARAELEFTRRKLDAAVYIDARTVPERTVVNIAVGLVESGNATALGFLAGFPNLKQFILATGVSPWVYVGVTWPPFTPAA